MKSVYPKKRKKILALLLAAAMLISAVSFAEEPKGQPAEDAAMDESFILDEAQPVKEAPLQCSSGASSMRKAGSGRKAATCGWQVS